MGKNSLQKQVKTSMAQLLKTLKKNLFFSLSFFKEKKISGREGKNKKEPGENIIALNYSFF